MGVEITATPKGQPGAQVAEPLSSKHKSWAPPPALHKAFEVVQAAMPAAQEVEAGGSPPLEAATVTERNPVSRTKPTKQKINEVWGCTAVTPSSLGRVKAIAYLSTAWANGNLQVTLVYTRSCLKQTKEMNEASKMARLVKDLLPDLSEFDPRTHMMEGENPLCPLFSEAHTYTKQTSK